jgi:hypothetical protein
VYSAMHAYTDVGLCCMCMRTVCVLFVYCDDRLSRALDGSNKQVNILQDQVRIVTSVTSNNSSRQQC